MQVFSTQAQAWNRSAKIRVSPAQTRFLGGKNAIGRSDALAQAAMLYIQQLDAKADPQVIRQAIQQNQPIRVGGRTFLYGMLQKGQVESPFPKAKKLAERASLANSFAEAQPFLIQVENKASEQALKQVVHNLLPVYLEGVHVQAGVSNPNVIYSEVIEKLVSGQGTRLAPDLAKALNQAFSGKQTAIRRWDSNGKEQQEPADFAALDSLYRLILPKQTPEQVQQLNQHADVLQFRQQLLGLELARKAYAEDQEVEWESIALSLAMGGIAEPTVSHFFKDGGPVASAIRTTLLSGVDIMGNVLSVMGVVSEKQKAKNQKLSLDTIFGPKGKRNYLNPQGSAGPDIKQGIKLGVGGGLFGVLYNIPVGMLLSQPNGNVLSRAIVGGLSSTGSAVAIPKVIQDSQNAFIAVVESLVQAGKIIPPADVNPKDTKQLRAFATQVALKELNTRIGYASSIKATHPLPLLGTGALILSAEKLGIPREYVQTAYMSLAPVMHNFVRLLYTGKEMFMTTPQRMKKLETLALTSDRMTDAQKQKALDDAMLQDTWITRWLTQTGKIILTGVVLLAAELLVFQHAYQKNKAELKQTPLEPPRPSAFTAIQPPPARRWPPTTEFASLARPVMPSLGSPVHSSYAATAYLTAGSWAPPPTQSLAWTPVPWANHSVPLFQPVSAPYRLSGFQQF